MQTRSPSIRSIVAGAVCCLTAFCLGIPLSTASSEWTVPKEADLISNPVPLSQGSKGRGSIIYGQRCAVCHGAKGRGDGPSALSLGIRPADLASPDIRAQSDGRLFWKIAIGRGPMPSWDVVLSEEDRWYVINYLRALPTTR